jgi:ribonuclease BN (tRNA processing enzyme)
MGWGHSTPRACIREASECGARRLGITHHDPQHDDRHLGRMETRARRYNRRLKQPVPELFFLREGMELEL